MKHKHKHTHTHTYIYIVCEFFYYLEISVTEIWKILIIVDFVQLKKTERAICVSDLHVWWLNSNQQMFSCLIFFVCRNETLINYRRVTRFQQTNNLAIIPSLIENNKYKISRNVSSVIFPHLISFAHTTNICREEWIVVRAMGMIPSIYWTPMTKSLKSTQFRNWEKALLRKHRNLSLS